MPLFLRRWLLSLQPGASRSSDVAPAPALLARSPVCQEGRLEPVVSLTVGGCLHVTFVRTKPLFFALIESIGNVERTSTLSQSL